MHQVFGLIGDVHAEDKLLARAIDWMRRRTPSVDAILCVGDIADGYGDINKCCELLRNYNVDTVRGNHDRWLLQGVMRQILDATSLESIRPDHLEWLQQLPPTREFPTTSGKLLLCHGLGEKDMAKVNPDDFGYAVESNTPLQDLIDGKYYRFVVNGHSHRHMVRSFGNLTIINAGTLRRGHQSGFGILDFNRGTVERFEFSPAEEISPAGVDRIETICPAF